jgi:primosomal protein N' (replication factor Y)
MDLDTTRRKDAARSILRSFAAGEIDLLIGTQMIAKGHHFPRVTLVGVLSADATLHLPDFRAAERTFQLLTQVAGRAGRGDRPGSVIVQAFRPEHPVLGAALDQDYRAFAAREVAARELLRYPPSAALANLLVRDEDQAAAQARAADLAGRLRTAGEGHVAVLGPTSAPLARLAGQWRVQILLRARRRRRIQETLRRVLADLAPDGQPPRGLTLDIDPYSLL